jgi:hypothetical protein
MNRTRQILGQHLMNHALALHPAYASKGLRLNDHGEVTFTAFTGARMTLMFVAIVNNLQICRRKGCIELFPHTISHKTHKSTCQSLNVRATLA